MKSKCMQAMAVVTCILAACGSRTRTTAEQDAAGDLGKGTGGSPGSTDAQPPACESLPGGTCASMANGCAVCPAGTYVNPTREGCSGSTWCCTKQPPPTSPCGAINGVCVANADACPNRWKDVETSCNDSVNSVCCTPDESDCPAFPQRCADIGGVCTASRWIRCPAGTEPYALDADQLGCEGDWDGWCCVDAPPSSCADSREGGMCVPGDKCKGCFEAHPNASLTCEPGRVCCVDMCD